MGGGEGDWLDTAVDPEAIQGGEKPIIEAEQTSYFWVCLKQIKPVRRATLKPFSDDFGLPIWRGLRTEDIWGVDHTGGS